MNIKYIIVSTIIGLTNISTNFCMQPQDTHRSEKKDQTKKTHINPWLDDINEEELKAQSEEYPYLGVFKVRNHQEFLDLIKKTLKR
ncbi:MAG: hypothetical protein US69_C0004G0023 [candidate division TM6 bacterium GW2011_GWF2_38_10]|nr:MAG: hypothetical protein US69_C0004G0023 [candidate division TM6 bacterium GW2011_GWF2_38_10]